jgi:hypothetical protein
MSAVDSAAYRGRGGTGAKAHGHSRLSSNKSGPKLGPGSGGAQVPSHVLGPDHSAVAVTKRDYSLRNFGYSELLHKNKLTNIVKRGEHEAP